MVEPNIRIGKIGYVFNDEKIPEGAILVTAKDMLELQRRLIVKWRPEREMFMLKYGTYFLAGVAAASGYVIALGFRSLMQLGGRGRTLSFLPNTFLPGLLTIVTRETAISDHILMGNDCNTCLNIRSSVLQTGTSVLNSLGLTLVASSFLAKSYSTYPLPPIYEYKTLLKIYYHMLKAMKTPIFTLIFLNIFGVSVVNYKQRVAVSKLNEKIMKEESTLI